MDALSQIRLPSQKRIAIHIKPAAERAIRQGHPWLFDQAIRKQSREGYAGDLAVIFDQKDRFLAIGLYDPNSPIRVRILQHEAPAAINDDWFLARLDNAFKLRETLFESDTTGFRLVHGENDGLPGLVIDCYGESLVAKLDTAAWVPHLATIVPLLLELFPAERVVLRLSRQVQRKTDALYGLRDGQIIVGSPLKEPVVFQENGLMFEADLVKGQKTGFFLDQRDNRARVAAIVNENLNLKQVLNVFAYTGGFSIYAASGGAKSVLDIDISKPALFAANRNFKLNDHIKTVNQAEHETINGDAFQILVRLEKARRQFDLVVIDPPSFARRQTEVTQAVNAYGRLVYQGLAVLRPGGVLVMASCSSRVNAEVFFKEVYKSAGRARRVLKEIARTGHPLDHPVTFPEGAYLKCLFAIVE